MAPLETASTFLVSMTTQYTTILPRHDNPVSVYGRTEYIALSLSLSHFSPSTIFHAHLSDIRDKSVHAAFSSARSTFSAELPVNCISNHNFKHASFLLERQPLTPHTICEENSFGGKACSASISMVALHLATLSALSFLHFIWE
jgi:hypothetical protein